jgi:hypothetical protein
MLIVMVSMVRLLVVASLFSNATAHPQTNPFDTTRLSSNGSVPSITFGPCPEEFPPVLDCANYSVPIDWDNPEGEKFNLAMVRWPANANSSKKIGSLLINPGGPGGSATSFIVGLYLGVLPFPQGLNDAFDIIGLDPRGVGFSNPVMCDQKIFAERVSVFPKTKDEYDALIDKNKRYGESCRNMTGPLVEYMDTISVVKVNDAESTNLVTVLIQKIRIMRQYASLSGTSL